MPHDLLPRLLLAGALLLLLLFVGQRWVVQPPLPPPATGCHLGWGLMARDAEGDHWGWGPVCPAGPARSAPTPGGP